MSDPQEWVALSQNVPGHGLSGDGAAQALSQLMVVTRWQRLRGRRPRWWYCTQSRWVSATAVSITCSAGRPGYSPSPPNTILVPG